MGEHSLSFRSLHRYDPGDDGITVPAVLRAGQREARLRAKVDTGAHSCIFQRQFGDILGLDVESGDPKTFSTATGSFSAFGHNLTISVLGIEFDSIVYFASDPAFPRNVLGRYGWIQRIRMGIVDYDGEILLSAYDDESP